MASRKLVTSAVFALALLLRLLAIVAIGHNELLHGTFELKNDESSYHRPAVALATEGCYCWAPGGQPTAYRPPGIILPLAALYWFFDPAPELALGYVLLCSMALVALLRPLARATSADRRVADAATWIAALMPTLLWTSSGIWSDAPALLFTLLTLWLTIAMRADAWWKWLAVGASAALAYFNRPSAIFLFPFLLLAAVCSASDRRRFRNVALLALSLAMPIGVWGLRNWYAFGELYTGATVAGHTVWESNNPLTAGLALPAKQFENGVDLWAEARAGHYLGSWVPAEYIPGSEVVDARTLPEMQTYHGYMNLAIDFARHHPLAIAKLMAFKLWRLFSAEPVAASISGDAGRFAVAKRSVLILERWFIFAFAGLGLWQLYRTRSPVRHLYTAFAFAGLASVFVAYVNARLLLPVTGVLLVPAAMGLVWLWDRTLPSSSR
ncbi:MAG: glycosyltransferase family 39 protein [Deltaproteobacteria bacterium]|nr:glycosyltransferase family 39 protein [Deltaproteobacteria bacterium]